MNALGQIAHLLAIDPMFRLAFLSNPDEAIAARGWALDAEGRAALVNILQRLVASPQELTSGLSPFTNIGDQWGGGMFADDVAPAPQPL